MSASGLTVTARASKHKRPPEVAASGGLLCECHIGVVALACYQYTLNNNNKSSKSKFFKAFWGAGGPCGPPDRRQAGPYNLDGSRPWTARAAGSGAICAGRCCLLAACRQGVPPGRGYYDPLPGGNHTPYPIPENNDNTLNFIEKITYYRDFWGQGMVFFSNTKKARPLAP